MSSHNSCALCGFVVPCMDSRPHQYVSACGLMVFCSDRCALSYNNMSDMERVEVIAAGEVRRIRLAKKNEWYRTIAKARRYAS